MQRARPIVWIVGPPGSGKTVLVAEYAQARELPGVWFHADSGDSDPATFFYFLGLAAKKAAPRAKRAMPLLTPEFQSDLANFSRRYFRELFAKLPKHSILVFDNYHEITHDSPLHAALQEGLLEIPDGPGVIVLSRTEAPIQFARLLALDRIARIDWADLRLTLDETRQIATVRYPVDEQTLKRLFERCEGWVAGLTLMLERLGRSDSNLSEAHSSSEEAVFEFFAGEIFERAPADQQQMLLAAAFLPRPTAAGVETLSGHSGAARLLDHLYRRHLFTDRRSSSPPTYQFHDLFRAFLISKAKEIYSTLGVNRLACRAAQFLEQQGQPEHALALALDGQDWPGSVRLVCAEAARLIAQGRGQVLRDWIAAIPKDVQNTAPWLAYWRGASLIAVDPTAAIGVIAHAADRLRDSAESFGDMLACAGVIHAIYLEWSDLTKMDDWINRLEALMEKRPALPSTDAALSIYSALLIGCFNRKPASHALEFAADEVETLLQQEANPNLKVTASMALLFYLAASRQLARARPLLDLMVPVVEGSSISPLNRMMWWSRAGIVFIRCSEFQEAAKAIRTAEDISRHGGAAFRSVVVHMPTAFLAAINRDDVLGKQTIQAMEQSRDPRRKLDECFVHYASCMLASVHGDPADIVRHGEKGLRSARAGGMYFSEIGLQFSIAVGYVQTGNWTEAILQLDQIRDSILGTYLEYCMDDVLAIEVCLAFAQGNIDHGRKVLQTLMSRAVEGGTSFLRYGFVWSTVFSKAIEYRIEAEKASILIRRFQLKSPTYLTDHWPWPVRVHVLGAFELNTELTASSAAKPAYKLLEMLRTIACHENRGVSVSWVKETLWAESEGDAAERAFHTSLYRLRKLLGNDAAVLHGDGCLRLNPEICWTDLLAFNQIVAEVESHLPSAKTDRLQYLSTRCIELYRGELLAQHREIAWTIAPRDRTRSQFRRTLSRLGEAWEQAGAPDKAMELYQLGIERDNLAEEFYRRLMLCYQTRGDHAEAINVYRRCRELLSVVLGTTPSAQTQAVRASLGV